MPGATQQGWLALPRTHHALDDAPEGAALDVLSDEVEPLVLVEHPDELEHVGVFQASHDLHLLEECPLGLLVEPDQLLHHHHLTRLTVCHLDGLAKAALAQHLPVDEVRRPEDAVWPADYAEGLRATQVLALGGRGAQ